mgnify:CR=1 FL=1|jgi:hypothetical protein
MSINIKACLIDNFESIQSRINEINSKEKIDIKEISDLQRYIEMQSRIIKSMDAIVDVYEINN